MKHDLFERLLLATGLLVGFAFVMMSVLGINFLEEMSGNHLLHKDFIDLGLIKINIMLFYFLVALIGVAIFWFIGRLIDKMIINIWGEEMYSTIITIVFIIFVIVFGGIGAFMGFMYFSNIFAKLGASLIGFVIGIVIAYKLLLDGSV